MTWPHDVADPGLYADPVRMHATFTRLRREQPVAWCAPDGFAPFWAVSRYDDVAAISRASEAFTSQRRTILFDRAAEAAFRAQAAAAGEAALVRSLATMDDPEHHAHRRLTQSWFMPANLRNLEPQIREIARDCVAQMLASGGRCDFAADIAVWYPLRVIMAVLGVEAQQADMMLRLTQQLFAPAETADSDPATGVLAALEESRAFFAALTEDRRRRPREDLASVIATAQLDGAPIGELEAFSYYNIIATAGHDTTSSTAAVGVLALCEHPAELAALRAGDVPMARAVEEMIRWASPVRHFMRVATREHRVDGALIEPGQAVMLLYPSANRDERAFEAPDELRLDRQPNRHLGFGHGPHSCLGMNLARLELRILFEELLARTRDWRLDGPVTWVRSSFVGGPKQLPLAFSAA